MNNQCVLEVSKPFNKFGVIVCSFIFLAVSTNSQAESCNDAKAIEQYNTAISIPDVKQKLELLQGGCYSMLCKL